MACDLFSATALVVNERDATTSVSNTRPGTQSPGRVLLAAEIKAVHFSPHLGSNLPRHSTASATASWRRLSASLISWRHVI